MNPTVIYTVDIVDHTICECSFSPMSKMCQIEYLLNPPPILSFFAIFPRNMDEKSHYLNVTEPKITTLKVHSAIERPLCNFCILK